MPKILPPGGEVSWPKNEGVLGVVGVAPWATIQFCQQFYALADAKKDWHYPRVLLDVNTKLPSRGRYLQLGETNPSPYITETIEELAAAGATVAVVVCNTAHILYDQWARSTSIPVINIIDAAVAEARCVRGGGVASLVSESLAKHNIYGRAIDAAGLESYSLPEMHQSLVSGFIEQVKVHGRLNKEDDVAVGKLIDHLNAYNVGTVLLGCTELSVLEEPLVRAGFAVIDSNKALAAAAYAAVCKSE